MPVASFFNRPCTNDTLPQVLLRIETHFLMKFPLLLQFYMCLNTAHIHISTSCWLHPTQIGRGPLFFLYDVNAFSHHWRDPWVQTPPFSWLWQLLAASPSNAQNLISVLLSAYLELTCTLSRFKLHYHINTHDTLHALYYVQLMLMPHLRAVH
jgi:hypothetical protein